MSFEKLDNAVLQDKLSGSEQIEDPFLALTKFDTLTFRLEAFVVTDLESLCTDISGFGF